MDCLCCCHKGFWLMHPAHVVIGSVLELMAPCMFPERLTPWLGLRLAVLADAVNEPLFGGKERTGATTSDGLGAASNEEQPATIGSSRRLTSGMHVATLPSGFVVDDLQNSGASLPQRSSYHAASTAAAGSARSARVKTMHELHHPEGRGTGAASALHMLHWAGGATYKHAQPSHQCSGIPRLRAAPPVV